MQHLSPEMQACVETCLRCHSTCLGMASHHCLEAGGKHVEPQYFRLMLACAEMCRASATMMLIGTEHHKQTCRSCAEVCEACAKSCEQIGDMEECVQACRACAESCHKMGA